MNDIEDENNFDVIEVVGEYFTCKNYLLDHRSLKWLTLSKYQLYDVILNSELNVSLSDLDNPLNCLFVSSEYKNRQNLKIIVKTSINFLKLLTHTASFTNLKFIRKCMSRRSGIRNLTRYMLISRLLGKYVCAVKEHPPVEIDDLNMPLSQRFEFAISKKYDSLIPGVHGGGFLIYKGFPFDDFDWRQSQMVLNLSYFKLIPRLSNKTKDTKAVSVSVAPYWFHKLGGRFSSQDFLSTNAHVKLINSLQSDYGLGQIVIRDPSRLATYFKNEVFHDIHIDCGEKIKSTSDPALGWSKEFLQADLKIVTAFFTLGLQLLYANQPVIIYVTRSSFYEVYMPEVDELIECGVFITELNTIRKFSNLEELHLWWDESEKVRKEFIKKYLEQICLVFDSEMVVE